MQMQVMEGEEVHKSFFALLQVIMVTGQTDFCPVIYLICCCTTAIVSLIISQPKKKDCMIILTSAPKQQC